MLQEEKGVIVEVCVDNIQSAVEAEQGMIVCPLNALRRTLLYKSKKCVSLFSQIIFFITVCGTNQQVVHRV